MIMGLGHAGLVVRDMDKMVNFYQDNFGFQVVLDTMVGGKEANNIVNFHVESERIVVMQFGESQIELLEYRPSGRDYPDDYRSNDIFGVHIALLTNNMEQDYEMLKEKGVTIISTGPQTIPKEHPIFGGTKVLYLRDPEGHPLELIQIPE
ncbi:MAG: VOC family protein [Deltaproteobacteria bacterium]|nr:VOC family protein [Deltaproteobacteria bacterium]